ncbi:MAG: hypothetical protein EXR67_07355 [Dehalococcoidia bacterium]|nr:hypothetical protein [Dehalococcoidia bacterium]
MTTPKSHQPAPVGTAAQRRLERDIRGRAAQGESPRKIATALGIDVSVVMAALHVQRDAGNEASH